MKILTKTDDFWLKNKDHCENAYLSSTNWRSEMIARIISQNNIKSVLEIGCGSGNVLQKVAELSPQVNRIVGFDLNRYSLLKAKEKIKIKDCDFICGSVYDGFRHFSDKSFDIVFTSGCLMYLLPTEMNFVIPNISRISKKFVLHVERFGNYSGLHQRNIVNDVSTFVINYIAEYNKVNINLKKIELNNVLDDYIKVGEAKDLMFASLGSEKITFDFQKTFGNLSKNKK